MNECGLYQEPEPYDLLFPSASQAGGYIDDEARTTRLVASEQFYLEEARNGGGPVFELACGSGRMTTPIAKAGVNIVGMDLLASMLDAARNKASALGVDVKFVAGDMRSFELPQKFSTIFHGGKFPAAPAQHRRSAALFLVYQKASCPRRAAHLRGEQSGRAQAVPRFGEAPSRASRTWSQAGRSYSRGNAGIRCGKADLPSHLVLIDARCAGFSGARFYVANDLSHGIATAAENGWVRVDEALRRVFAGGVRIFEPAPGVHLHGYLELALGSFSRFVGMFWFKRKKLLGSYFDLTATNRSQRSR